MFDFGDSNRLLVSMDSSVERDPDDCVVTRVAPTPAQSNLLEIWMKKGQQSPKCIRHLSIIARNSS